MPGPEHVQALRAAAPILVGDELVRKGMDVNVVVEQLVEPGFARASVVAKN